MGALLNRFRDLVQAAGGILGMSVIDKDEHLKIGESLEDGLTVISTEMSKPLIFRNVPLGTTRAPKSMALALSFKASFEEVAGVWTIRKCTITSSYWTPRNEKDGNGIMRTHFRHSHSFHFDYHHFPHRPGSTIHPTFHVQPAGKVIGETTAGFRAPLKAIVANAKNPRVPTPPMDLPAVIEMLFADHFPQVMKQQTMKGWIAARGMIPRLTPQPCSSHPTGRSACCYYDGCLETLMTS